MGKRRMFSLNIINSARFLKMPIDSQVLYFHLGLRADDDGIVEAYPVMKLLGNTEDNLKVLVAKEFVKILNEDLVAFITDWTEHNLIRADRKVDSIYKHLLLQIMPDVELLEAKPRADTKKPTGQPMDVQCPPKLSKDKLSKDKLNTFFESFYSLYPKKIAKSVALKRWLKLSPSPSLLQVILKDVECRKKSEQWQKDDGRFIPYPATYLNQQRWEDEEVNENIKDKIYYGK